MNTNTTLELRQADALVYNNGDYNCKLGAPVTINSGDQIYVKQVYLDNRDDGVIFIPEDITLHIANLVYITDWFTANDKNFVDTTGTPITPAVITADRYIPYKKESNQPIPNGVVNYTRYNYQVNIPEGATVPQLTLSYTYKNAENETKTHTSPTVGPFVGPISEVYTDVFVPALRAFIDTLEPTALLPPFFVPIGGETDGTPPVGDLYTPFIFQTDIKLKAGNYNPDEISFLISQYLNTQNIHNEWFNNILSSSFFHTSNEFDNGSTDPTDPNTSNPYQTLFVGPKFGRGLTFNAGANYLIGASQMALQYDSVNSRFQWTFMHTPMYDDNGQTIVVRFVNELGTPDFSSPTAVTENGGVFFTNLAATVDSTGLDYDFWSGQLGFDLNSLLVNPFADVGPMLWGYRGYFKGILNDSVLIPESNLVTGYWGADALVIKQKDLWYKAPDFNTLPNELTSSITATTVINATRSTVELADKFSHYIISLDLNFITDTYISAEQNYRNFNSIVSKYYAYGSYTYASSDASIIYTHQGVPAMLKDISVRVLRPDKTLDPKIESDNTVIVSIIKAPPQPQPTNT
jgi:hypothetical protein